MLTLGKEKQMSLVASSQEASKAMRLTEEVTSLKNDIQRMVVERREVDAEVDRIKEEMSKVKP
jgi:peptidoglycan hydrolase CwlO-like protein